MDTNSRNIFGRVSVGSLDQLLVWGDHFKVDHPQIDAQHEAIFHIAMEIARVWEARGDIDRVRRLTDKLEMVLAVHFRYEEAQLAALGDPTLEEHKTEHKAMFGELHVIRRRLATMDDVRQAGPGFSLHDFLLGLVVGHITHGDMDYCALARKQVGKTGPHPIATLVGELPADASASPLAGERIAPIQVASVAPGQPTRAGSMAAERERPVSRE